jgi:hypothetical protein
VIHRYSYAKSHTNSWFLARIIAPMIAECLSAATATPITYLMRKQISSFTGIENQFPELITDGPALNFKKDDIARIRKEIKIDAVNVTINTVIKLSI